MFYVIDIALERKKTVEEKADLKRIKSYEQLHFGLQGKGPMNKQIS